MVSECPTCHRRFDDEYRTTICPHPTFAANSWRPDHPVNAHAHHPESYLESEAAAQQRKVRGA